MVTAFPLRPWAEDNVTASASGGKGLRGIIAGGITGGLESCITYPTEYVKTQLQLDAKGDQKKYSGVIDVVKKTVKQHGILGLYRGLSVLIYGSVPKAGVRFGTFEKIKSWSTDEKGNLSPAARLWCGLGAGCSEAVIAVTPMETVKVKLINDRRSPNPRFKGLFHAVKTIIKEEGPRGVYQGVVPTIMRQGSNQAMRFFVMETLKDAYRKGDPTIIVPKHLTAMFGVIAGAVSVYGNTPIDVVKTRMQGLDAKKYKGTLDCFVQIWKQEGPLAFYKGTIPRLLRVCLDVAVTFTLYDTITEFFDRMWPPA